MDDLISRKWLMECVDEGWIKFDTEKDTNTYIHLVRDIAPSAQPKSYREGYQAGFKDAQPERKRGKWIKVNGKTAINCSACYHCSWSRSFEDTVKRFNFCPYCGADMREDDHETD